MADDNSTAVRLAALEARVAEIAAGLHWLVDRQAIVDQLHRYSRALDRLDIELLASTFWPDARVDLGPGLYQGAARDLFGFAMQFQGAMSVTRHELGNILVEPEGPDRAFVESYVYAFHVVKQADAVQDLIVYGRYLDHFERRDGQWRISARTEVIDWAHERPSTADWFERQPPLNHGLHDMHDRLYALRPSRG